MNFFTIDFHVVTCHLFIILGDKRYKLVIKQLFNVVFLDNAYNIDLNYIHHTYREKYNHCVSIFCFGIK